MAVSVLNAWQGQTAGDPSGSLTISAGTNRMLFIQYFAEKGNPSPSFTSITVGGQAPTGSSVLTEVHGGANQISWAWYWDEAAIAAMSGTTAVLTQSNAANTEDWDYVVLQDVAGGASFDTYASDSSTDTATVSLENTTDDWKIVTVNRTSPNRDVTSWDNVTQEWQFNTDYTVGIADALGDGTADTVVTGDGIGDDWIVQCLVAVNVGAVTYVPRGLAQRNIRHTGRYH